MIKIYDKHIKYNGTLEIDEYIPFRFRANGVEKIGMPCYWRTGNFKKTLLEIQVDSSSGIITGITLTSYNKLLYANLPIEYNTAKVIEGLPLINLEKFQAKKIIDEIYEIRLIQQNDAFYLIFNDILPKHCFRLGRIGCFEKDGFLTGIGFFNMQSIDLTNLSKSLEQGLKTQ